MQTIIEFLKKRIDDIKESKIIEPNSYGYLQDGYLQACNDLLNFAKENKIAELYYPETLNILANLALTAKLTCEKLIDYGYGKTPNKALPGEFDVLVDDAEKALSWLSKHNI